MPQVVGQARPSNHGRHQTGVGSGSRHAPAHSRDVCAPQRPHVLQVFEPRTGGVPRYTENLARGLLDHGWRVSVACSPQCKVHDALLATGIDVMALDVRRSLQPARDSRAVAQLARWCREHNVTLIHGHSSKAGMLVALAGARAEIPSVYTPHGWAFERLVGPPLRAQYAFVERQLAVRYHAAVVTVSDSGRAAAERWRVAPRGRIRVVRTGLPPAPSIGRDAARRRLGIEPESLVAAWVGRVGAQKQPDHLTSIARHLAGRVEVVALCDGVHGTELADELRAAEVRLLDPGAEPAAVYAAADLLVHTSAWEASPLVVLEAMGAKLPVVAYDVGGLREQVRPGRTGFLVKPGDIEAMCRSVLALARDPLAREEIGNQAHRTVATAFSYSSMLDQIGQVYTAIAAGHGASRRPARRRPRSLSRTPAAGVADMSR